MSIIKYKNFDEFQHMVRIQLPNWYDEKIHIRVCRLIETQGKLHACKFLVDLSKQYDTTNVFGLTWSKRDICDNISPIELSLTPEELFRLKLNEFNKASVALQEAWKNVGYITNKEKYEYAMETIISCTLYLQKNTTQK
jgi:hypothetical protein